MTVVAIGILVLFGLMLLEVPIAFAMLAVGIGGFAWVVDWGPATFMAADTTYRTVHNYNLSVIPLFILMGNLISRADISRELFDLAHRFTGHYRGGLAISTVLAGAMFSALTGSSLATVATMAGVAHPSMRRYGYSDKLAAGAIASAGTLGIMIPPSVAFIVYGIMTNTDIGKLFIAGILPGLLGALLYIGAIVVATRVDPASGPAGERTDWAGRLAALRSVGAVVLLFIVVIGGIYGNLFTPTEAAGIGSVGALVITLWRRKLGRRAFFETLVDTAVTTATIFAIMVGAQIFSTFINVAGFTTALSSAVNALDLAPWMVIAGIIILYLVLGCLLEGMSMLLLTLPIVYPLVIGMGFDPIWFGVLAITLIEIGLITPPVGMNVYVLNSILPQVSLRTIFSGVAFFVLADFIRIALIVAIPAIVLFLPSLM